MSCIIPSIHVGFHFTRQQSRCLDTKQQLYNHINCKCIYHDILKTIRASLPLLNVYMAMENHHSIHAKTHNISMAIFNSYISHYQRATQNITKTSKKTYSQKYPNIFLIVYHIIPDFSPLFISIVKPSKNTVYRGSIT